MVDAILSAQKSKGRKMKQHLCDLKINKKIIVIPTPVRCEFTGRKVSFAGFKAENCPTGAAYALEMGRALLKDDGSGRLVFTGLKHKNKQAYTISLKAGEVTVSGAGDAAFIYAMSTLMQLAEFDGGKIILPEGEVLDYPKFEFRGVNWLLFVECRGWSQDACDGRERLIERFTSGLDTLAFFKLNAVFVDGFGWSPERFPGYGELMRLLNREARRRAIRLLFGGYNAGYGAQWRDFDGPVFQNRRSYPDGETYPCIDPQRHSEISRTMGTCLSNTKLLAEKKNNLVKFVRAVEPGMLYIHGVDIAYQPEAIKAWATRCPDCRRRWPNDEVNAPDGMAGAFAEFYDELYEAVSSVKIPESGYDGSRDCAVNMVSPNYTHYDEIDEEWKYHLDYFRTLTGHLKNKEIYLTLREQYFNCSEGGPRFKELRQVVSKGSKLSVVYFSSGSTFYNSLPVTADAACVRYFDGMDSVIAGSGNAFQEPRQAINAEYMWNPDGSAFKVELPDRGSCEKFLPYYHDLTSARNQPEAVFGGDGLLEVVCKKLYGSAAGKLAARACHTRSLPIHDPKRSHDLANPAGKPTPFAPIVPLTNEMLPGYLFSVFYKLGNHKVIWREELTDNAVAFAERYEKAMEPLTRMTDAAAANYRKAAELCESELPVRPEMRKAHLERMADTCVKGARLAEFTLRWLRTFLKARESVKSGTGEKEQQASIKTLRDDLTAFAGPLRAAAANAIDPNGGDTGQAVRTIDFMLGDLSNISHTLKTGEYLEVKLDKWW